MRLLDRICPLRRRKAARAADPYRDALGLAERQRRQKRAYRRALAELNAGRRAHREAGR